MSVVNWSTSLARAGRRQRYTAAGMAHSPERHRRLRAVFEDALREEPARRAAFLDDACDGDAALRAHVERLLNAHHDLDSFLAQPIGAVRADAAPAFSGTDRFTVIRQRGAGGMGIVYEVHDRLRREIVALKVLRRAGAADLYRLKHEFRSLADVAHPNLVCLYEMVVDDAHSFFTMELVDGVTFVEYVRGHGAGLSVERLSTALRQLVAGVTELHRRGKLHRDIKPSNVLVTGAGRLVILDFGLIAESAALVHTGDWAGGTPAFMSPEESAGIPPTNASDWYAVGVTLYEALTGVLPFAGTAADVIRAKQESDPVAPALAVSHEVPADLSELCMGLLRRTPATRLSGGDILRVLARTVGGGSGADPAVAQETFFVGRQAQLDALRGARRAVFDGAAHAAVVYGPSGIGKSALVRRFVRDLPPGEVMVLAGRCYENESVPYKALDGVVDDLSRYLAAQPAAQVRALLPGDMTALARLFPVLLQVESVASAVRRADQIVDADPVLVRRTGIETLKQLLAGLTRARSLVVWIDDLQWADADSLVLLTELLTSPPAMLTLLSFRQEEIGAKPPLQALVDRAATDPQWSSITVEPLNDGEAMSLIDGVIGEGTRLTDADRRALAREASGSPFVLEQLSLHAGSDAARALTVAEMLDSRLAVLDLPERAFLETLALCGRPVAPDVICDACGTDRDRQSVVVRLRASRLIRSSGSSDRVEPYHDRIREAVAQRVPADAGRQIHGRMAAALVALDSDDCEALYEHYRGAGDRDHASAQAVLSATRTAAALAFDRAAFFYEQALALTPDAPGALEWREAQAAALANAGRPPAAADAYLAAAALAGATAPGAPAGGRDDRRSTAAMAAHGQDSSDKAAHRRRVELQRRAAEQFLVGGHIDRGLALMRQILAEVGLPATRSPRTAAWWVVWRRARLYWRGLQFAERASADVDPDELLRLDTSWAVASGLALVDVVSASNYVAQHLHLALDAGDPSRICRGAALEWAARNADWQFRPGGEAFHALAMRLAERVRTPQARATVALADSLAAVASGEWQRGLLASERALTILREECVGATWEMTIAQNTHLWSLMYRGELREVSRLVPEILDDARRRGNLYLATEVCTRSNFVWLAADDPDGGEREVMNALANWSPHGFHRQHYSAMLARVQTALYRGDGPAAWQLFERQQRDLKRSMLMRVQALRVESRYLHARCAIAVAVADPSRRGLLAAAARRADRIANERMPWSDGLALLLRGCIANVEGRREESVQLLDQAATRFDAQEMKLYLAITRRRLASLLDNERGRVMQRDAETWMASQRIANPVKLTRMLAPGFADAPLLT